MGAGFPFSFKHDCWSARNASFSIIEVLTVVYAIANLQQYACLRQIFEFIKKTQAFISRKMNPIKYILWHIVPYLQ